MLFMRPCDLGTAFWGTFSAVGKSASTAGANTGNTYTKQVNKSCYKVLLKYAQLLLILPV